jgi:hypothetical protein
MKIRGCMTPSSGFTGLIDVRVNWNLEESGGRTMQLIRGRARHVFVLLITRTIVLLMISYAAFSQTEFILDQVHCPDGPIPALNLETLSFHGASVGEAPVASEDSGDPSLPESRGFVRRGATRLLRDQKELYLAPFQRSNFEWDAIVLGGTAALLATDRRIERHLPGGNVDIYGDFSNVALGGTAAALALAWGYGIKTHNEHLKETGLLEVEALVNTFLIYTPTQLPRAASARERAMAMEISGVTTTSTYRSPRVIQCSPSQWPASSLMNIPSLG